MDSSSSCCVFNVEEEVVVIRNGWTPKKEKKNILMKYLMKKRLPILQEVWDKPKEVMLDFRMNTNITRYVAIFGAWTSLFY